MVRWRWVGSTFVFRMIWMNCLKIKETCGAYSKATYTHVEFKRDVLAHLQKKFDSSVKPGNKAVEVEASGSRRSADVLVAIQFRKLSPVHLPGQSGVRFGDMLLQWGRNMNRELPETAFGELHDQASGNQLAV